MTKKTNNHVDDLIKDPLRVKPKFIDEPGVDKLVAVVMRLAMENGVLRDRITRQEQLLKSKNILSDEDYDGYTPDAKTAGQSQDENFNLIRAIAKDLG